MCALFDVIAHCTTAAGGAGAAWDGLFAPGKSFVQGALHLRHPSLIAPYVCSTLCPVAYCILIEGAA
eukprot:1159929-Pelagomonas_calceolata.AAC.25